MPFLIGHIQHRRAWADAGTMHQHINAPPAIQCSVATSSSTLAERATSTVIASAIPPPSTIAFATACADAARSRSATTTHAPCCASRKDEARPPPLPPPVMTIAILSRHRHQLLQVDNYRLTKVASVAPKPSKFTVTGMSATTGKNPLHDPRREDLTLLQSVFMAHYVGQHDDGQKWIAQRVAAHRVHQGATRLAHNDALRGKIERRQSSRGSPTTNAPLV